MIYRWILVGPMLTIIGVGISMCANKKDARNDFRGIIRAESRGVVTSKEARKLLKKDAFLGDSAKKAFVIN